MGDRVVITFTDGEEFSPSVYMHWHGADAPALLRDAQPKMRAGDLSYAAARFVGHCHETIKGPLSLGLFNGPVDRDSLASGSHGDAGHLVVNINTGAVEVFDGYTKPFDLDPARFARG